MIFWHRLMMVPFDHSIGQKLPLEMMGTRWHKGLASFETRESGHTSRFKTNIEQFWFISRRLDGLRWYDRAWFETIGYDAIAWAMKSSEMDMDVTRFWISIVWYPMIKWISERCAPSSSIFGSPYIIWENVTGKDLMWHLSSLGAYLTMQSQNIKAWISETCGNQLPLNWTQVQGKWPLSFRARLALGLTPNPAAHRNRTFGPAVSSEMLQLPWFIKSRLAIAWPFVLHNLTYSTLFNPKQKSTMPEMTFLYIFLGMPSMP